MVKTLAAGLLLALATGGCGGLSDRSEAGSSTVVASSDFQWTFHRGLLSPTDETIAVEGLHGRESAIGLIVDGETHALLPEGSGAHEVAWFPDGDRLLVAARDQVGSADALLVVDRDGEVLDRVDPEKPTRIESGMAVAPDGKTAIVSRQAPGLTDTPADLVRIDLSTGDLSSISNTSDVSETFPVFLTPERIVFSQGALVDAAGPNGSLTVFDLVTGERDMVTPPSHIAGTASAVDETTLIYFAVDEGAGHEASLWKLDLENGSEPKEIPGGEGRYPSVSSDGEQVLVLSAPTPGRIELLLIDLK